MAISEKKIYPRSRDAETVYLKNVVTDPGICVGDYTIYNDFKNDPREFQTNNVLFIKLFWLELLLETALSLAPALLLRKMYRLTQLLAVYRQSRYAGALMRILFLIF